MKKLACVLIAWSAMTATGISADESLSVMESPCAKLPAPCNILCQEAWSAESRAVALEATANDARFIADKARNRAVYYEDLAKLKTQEAMNQNTKKPWIVKRQAYLLWKSADFLLRFLVPRDARNTYRSKSIPDKDRTDAKGPTRKEEEAAEATKKADEAWEIADSDKKAADAAKGAAEAARAAADAARRSYEGCGCR